MAEVGWPTILPNTKYERRRMLELERTLGVFDIDYNLLNYKIENIIQNVHTFKHLDFYSIINYKKTNKNNLEKLLYSINFKNSFLFYPKIIFLENYDIIDSYQSIILFLRRNKLR